MSEKLYTRDEFVQLLARMRRKFYIYRLHDSKGRVFYVGKGSLPVKRPTEHRVFMHEKDAKINGIRQGACSVYIRTLWAKGFSILYSLGPCARDQSLILTFEQAEIASYGRLHEGGPLVNLTAGGEGMHGYKLPEETRLKMSRTRLGRKQSAAHNASISRGRLASERVRLENLRRCIPLLIMGKWYQSAVHASRALGVPKDTIRYRVKVGWTGYELAERQHG